MSFPYPNQRYTTNLGLSLFGMDEVLADNMNLIDQAYGAGSSINVNGTLVESPNLNNTTPAAPAGKTNVLWQVDANGNISAYASGGGGSTPGGPTNSIQYNAGSTLGGLASFSLNPLNGEVTIIDTEASGSNLAALSIKGDPALDDIQDWYQSSTTIGSGADMWVDSGTGLNWAQDANIAAGRSVNISAGGSGRTQIFGIKSHLLLDTAAAGVFDLNNGSSTAYVRSDNVGTLTLLGNNGVNLSCGATGNKIAFSSAFSTASDMNLQSTITDGYGQTGSSGQLLSSDGSGRIEWINAPTGGVTSFSAGNLSPLFTTSVATPTTTPVLSFTLSNASANTALMGPASGGAAAPTFRALVSADIPNNAANTSGSAASLSISGQTGLMTVTGLTSTNRIKTVRDAADTILELGGSYTPTGTWTSLTLVTPALGTPASGTLTNCTSLPAASVNAGALASGMTATTQSAQDNSTKLATTAYVDAVVPSTKTPAFCLPFTSFMPSAAESTTTFGAANTQEEVMFVMDTTMTFSHVTVNIGTGVTSALMGVALYNAAGTTKLAGADAFSVDTTHQGAQRIALSASVTLYQNTAYWLAWTATTGTTLTCQNFLQSSIWQAVYNAGAVRSGTSGTATTGGTTGTTIGTVSSAQLRIPLMIFD
jgi:hypothetical protein